MPSSLKLVELCTCLHAARTTWDATSDGHFAPLQRSAVFWPARLTQAAAICNALTFVHKNKVVGDAAEQEMYNAVEARFVVRCSSFPSPVGLSQR